MNVFQDSIRGDVATSNFIKSLSKFEQLESINLSANCVAAKSLQALDQLLQSNPTLKTLNLAVNSNALKKAILFKQKKEKQVECRPIGGGGLQEPIGSVRYFGELIHPLSVAEVLTINRTTNQGAMQTSRKF